MRGRKATDERKRAKVKIYFRKNKNSHRREVKTMYEYRGYTIIISKVDSCVYARKAGKLIFTAHDEPTIESMIDCVSDT